MGRRRNRSALVRDESAEDLRCGIDESGRHVYEVFDDRVKVPRAEYTADCLARRRNEDRAWRSVAPRDLRQHRPTTLTRPSLLPDHGGPGTPAAIADPLDVP